VGRTGECDVANCSCGAGSPSAIQSIFLSAIFLSNIVLLVALQQQTEIRPALGIRKVQPLGEAED
jgi:hypothetical protein